MRSLPAFKTICWIVRTCRVLVLRCRYTRVGYGSELFHQSCGQEHNPHVTATLAKTNDLFYVLNHTHTGNRKVDLMTMLCNSFWFGFLTDIDYVILQYSEIRTYPIRTQWMVRYTESRSLRDGRWSSDGAETCAAPTTA